MCRTSLTLQRIFFAALAVVVLLGGALAYHVHQVTSAPKGHLANIQMARLDLQGTIDQEQAAELKRAILAVAGVQHCFVNSDAGTVTYGYDRKVLTQGAVVDQVRKTTSLPVEQFVVSAKDVAGGCPINAPSASIFW